MITLKAIRALRHAAEDDQETEAIKELLSTRRVSEKSLYLTHEDFYRVARWKLGQQWGRVEHLLGENLAGVIEETTRLALSSDSGDDLYDSRFRFNILTCLRGVDAGIASEILALTFPEKYCVIDYRGWYQVFDEERSGFTFGQYKLYLDKVREFASALGWTPQEVDVAIWEFDRRNRHLGK